MHATPNAKLAKVRARLASDVAAFLSSGRKIHQVTHEETKMYRDRMAPKKKSNAGDHPFVINPAKGPAVTLAAERVNGADHPWTDS